MRINPSNLTPSVFKSNQKAIAKPAVPAGRMDSISFSSAYRSRKGSVAGTGNIPLDSKTKKLLEKAIQEELDLQAKESGMEPNQKEYGGYCWFATPNSKMMHLLPPDADPNGVTWLQAPYDQAVESLATVCQKETGLPLIRAERPDTTKGSPVEIETKEGEPNDEIYEMPSFPQSLPQSLIDWLIKSYQSSLEEENRR